MVARVLLGYPGWLLRCCYAVAKVPGVVARVLLCGCYVVAISLLNYNWVVCRSLQEVLVWGLLSSKPNIPGQ